MKFLSCIESKKYIKKIPYAFKIITHCQSNLYYSIEIDRTILTQFIYNTKYDTPKFRKAIIKNYIVAAPYKYIY